MAWYDTPDDWEAQDYFGDIHEDPNAINEILFGNDINVDMHAQDLFREAFFNDNDAAYIDLVEYVWDEYSIDFEDAFDWEDFREWYANQ